MAVFVVALKGGENMRFWSTLHIMDEVQDEAGNDRPFRFEGYPVEASESSEEDSSKDEVE